MNRAGSLLPACGVPDTMKVTVRVAVQHGHALGVTVHTDPAAPELTRCIDQQVRRLTWVDSPRMEAVTTSY